MSATPQPAVRRVVAWLPPAVIFGWWMTDLAQHWLARADYRFGWIVLLLAAYLVWDRWPGRPRTETPGPFLPSLALALVGLPAIVVAELYRIGVARLAYSSALLSVGCALLLAAYVRSLCGPATLRHFRLPLLLLFLAVPIPSMLWEPLVLGLQSGVTALSVELLNLAGIAAERHGTVIRLTHDVVGVDEACSGVRSLQGSLMVALFIGDLFLRRTSVKTVFVFVGIGLALLGNVGRSFFLAWSADRTGVASLHALHDPAGWSVLAFTALSIGLLAWVLVRYEQRRSSRRPARPPRPAPPPAPALVAPAFLPVRRWAVLTGLATLALGGPWAWFHVATPDPAAGLWLTNRDRLPGYDFVAEPLSPGVLDTLASTNVFNGSFHRRDPASRVTVFRINWLPAEGFGKPLLNHTPDVCWVQGGWKPVALDLPGRVTLALAGHELPFECRVFAGAGSQREIVFWITLLNGAPLPEPFRFLGETAARSRVVARLHANRLALGRLWEVVQRRTKASSQKQFIRCSLPYDGEPQESIARFQEFAAAWLTVQPFVTATR